MKNSKKYIAVVLAIALTLNIIFCTSAFAVEEQIQTQAQENSINAEYLESVMGLIQQKYNGNINEKALIESTIKGMFGSMDQYTMFLNQNEFNSFYESLGGAVEGVGIQAQFADNYVVVLKVFSNSPAQKAGMFSGDKIAEVDGESVVGKQLDDVIEKIKGPAGTTVKLGILRQGVKDILTLEMERAQVIVPSVKYEVRGDIGYILIDSFAANAYSGVSEALNLFDSKQITKVVLDLRNNLGGYVDQAVEVAKYFVPKGLITKLDYKDVNMEDESYYSSLEKTKYELAVLVNENSASAAEILTGAIKDTKAGVIIGNKTFGKAKVQDAIPILTPEAYERLNRNNDNKTVNAFDFTDVQESDVLGYSKMTIGMYYTPDGLCIDLKGIEPNIEVKAASPSGSGIQVNLLEPVTVTVKPVLGTQYMDVQYAECILKLLKYDVDTPDVTFDKKTFAAIKKFQKDNKVYSYGVLDFTTQKLLNKHLDTLKQTQDAAYAKAAEVLK